MQADITKCKKCKKEEIKIKLIIEFPENKKPNLLEINSFHEKTICEECVTKAKEKNECVICDKTLERFKVKGNFKPELGKLPNHSEEDFIAQKKKQKRRICEECEQNNKFIFFF